jgi:transposase-like protein
MSKKQSSRKSEAQKLFYTEAFKQKIINEVLSGKLNKYQASQLYGIKGNSTILYWMRQSQGLNPMQERGRPLANFADMKKNITDKKLEEENKELRELLKIAELRADVWQKALEIAEQKFDIEIVKKFGAQALRQLKKQGQKKK